MVDECDRHTHGAKVVTDCPVLLLSGVNGEARAELQSVSTWIACISLYPKVSEGVIGKGRDIERTLYRSHLIRQAGT